jgi:hypothetical protein
MDPQTENDQKGDRWMDKQTSLSYNGVFVRNEKEWNIDMYNMAEF